jgi:hypothetical protein
VDGSKFDRVLLRLCGEGTVLEGQPVGLAAASNGVARLHTVWQGDDLVAGWTTHPVSERRGPSARIFTNPKRTAGAVRTLQQIARLRSLRQLDERATVGAAYYGHRPIPSSRCSRPRSKPTTTWSSIMTTGTAIRPVRAINSPRAAASSATFFATNFIP